jgi:hypothetical protein
MIIKIFMRTQIKIILNMDNLLQLNSNFFRLVISIIRIYTFIDIFEGFCKIMAKS